MNELLEGTIARWIFMGRVFEGDEAARRNVLIRAYGAVIAVIAVGK